MAEPTLNVDMVARWKVGETRSQMGALEEDRERTKGWICQDRICAAYSTVVAVWFVVRFREGCGGDLSYRRWKKLKIGIFGLVLPPELIALFAGHATNDVTSRTTDLQSAAFQRAFD